MVDSAKFTAPTDTAAKPESLYEQLEAMIDRNSLLDVLTALECVCDEKALFIKSNGGHGPWDDRPTTALSWSVASKRLKAMARVTQI